MTATKIQLRRDTAANFTSANPILSSGEQAFETDTGKIKYGDGTTAWASLSYFTGVTPSDTNPIIDGAATIGSSLKYARQDHIHPTDTTRAPLSNPYFIALKQKRVTMSANDIDLSSGDIFTKTISTATTLTVSNIPVTSIVAAFILKLTNGGAGTITWFSGVKWVGGTAPTLTASGKDDLGFYTEDAGTTWTGLVLGKDIK